MENKNYSLLAALALLAILGFVGAKKIDVATDEWNGLKTKLVDAGVIDAKTAENRLNFLWALGLANKNAILEKGPMADPRYGGIENFASTGGWISAKGKTMDHYSRYEFIKLTDERQKLIEKMSKNIYRPCCNNPAYFPDCNHGMAMLGLLELMASEGASETEMYSAALKANAEWFPDAYKNIARYFAAKGLTMDKVDPKEILSAKYSSASGYQNILRELPSPESGNGGSC